jgi:hypothetical protein
VSKETLVFYQYDNADHEAKAKTVLAGLGEFVIAFERVCAEMRSCILCAFRREGLKNQGLSQVVINKSAVEALRSTLGGLFSELRGQDGEDKNAVKNLLARIDNLGSTRNELLHAEWYLNYDYEDASDEFTALALKHNTSQNGGAYSLKIPVTKAILDEHVKEATEILVLLRRLAICLNQNGFKVSETLSRPL